MTQETKLCLINQLAALCMEVADDDVGYYRGVIDSIMVIIDYKKDRSAKGGDSDE